MSNLVSFKDAEAAERLAKREAGAKAPANDILTEDSAAIAFADEYGGHLLYDFDVGAWFVWDGSVWRQNRTRMAFQFARELARKMAAKAGPKSRYAATKTGFAAGVERFAQSDPAFAVTSDVWDKDAMLLGTPGGTVDLRTGILRGSIPADRITRATSVAPAPLPLCPTWLAFLHAATKGDLDLIRFMQQWCGYCLTGLVKEHALVFVYGEGGNGKGVFLTVVNHVFNDYACTASMETFTAASGDRHSTDVAMLRGSRIVLASETEQGRAWAEARIKALTGGDAITARFMRQDNFTYLPTFKLFIIGNHKPALKNVGAAERRRFNLVPFEHKPERPDLDLDLKLKAEAPEILRWMIDGCLDWQANGLVRPDVVQDATAEYFSEQDLFRQWLDEECELVPDTYKTETSKDLFASWRSYALGAGDDPGTAKSFADRMQRSGAQKKKLGKGVRGWQGVVLVAKEAERVAVRVAGGG